MTSSYGFTKEAQQQRPKKDRKLSILYRRTSDQVHSGGLESLAISKNGDRVFTASRDMTVRSWQVGESGSTSCATYTGHCDWVNDVVLVDDVLASCSNDCTVRLWNANAEGVAEPLDTINLHTDYVTCLAASPDDHKVASAGLRGQVAIWNIALGSKSKVFGENYSDCSSPNGSVYALDLNSRANLLAVGSPGGVIKINDSRAPHKISMLKGHSDNIRSIILSKDGALCLSASSDKTIRLWDMGQQRCIQTLAVHTDSVWALATSDFQSVISGGRDCCIYRTQLASRSSELLFKEDAPITHLALGTDDTLWTTASHSTARCWDIQAQASTVLPPLSPRSPCKTPSGRQFYASPSPQMRLRQTRHSISNDWEPPAKRPRTEIKGLPPFVKCATLQDRRHVLTQNSEGKCTLWDVTSGLEKNLPFTCEDFADAEAKLFEPQAAVAPWFSPDVKTGSLCIQLENPSCFAAEIYASDLGFDDPSTQLKHNFGENLLKAVLERWVEKLSYDYVASGSANGANASDLASKSCFQLQCESAPLLLGQLSPNRGSSLFLKASDDLDGKEKNEYVPEWVQDAVLKGRYSEPADLKMAFLVLPDEGSGLPSLQQSRLNAPRILTMKKVADYVLEQLSRYDELAFEPYELFYDETHDADAKMRMAQREKLGGDVPKFLEFICNERAVPFDMSVGAIKSYIWRRSDAPEIKYRIYNSQKKALPAIIKPPSASN